MRTTEFVRSLSANLWVVTTLIGAIQAHAAPPAIDPCTLVTAAEVEQVLGKLAGSPKRDQLGDTTQCAYELADATNELDIWIGSADSLAPARKRAKQPSAVNGIGDEAILDRGRIDASTAELHIRKGKQILLLMLSDTPPATKPS